jgi:Arc/MetJ-type ribon-helix-helix transcriptional regulator
MVMDTLQIRMNHGLIKKVDELINTGFYSNRADVIRDAVRRLVMDKMIGILPNKGDSVDEIRKIRKKISSKVKGFNDIDEINKLAD